MDDSLARSAIQAALHGDWSRAEEINNEILTKDPENKDALNRLGKALFELGRVSQAKATYKKVLKIDSYDTIAQKALTRLSKAKPPKQNNKQVTTVYSSSFLEEPGKTKTVSLIHLGSKSVINNLDIADTVVLTPHMHRVSAQTPEGKFIGRLPDDISRRLIKLIRSGNEYEAFVRSVNNEGVRIFIRETKRSSTLGDLPSFPMAEKQNYIAFTSPDLIHKEKPEIEDEDD